MLSKTHLNKLKKDLHTYHKGRRDVIDQSNNALHHAKRAIFALHRDNMSEAKEKIAASEKLLKRIVTKYKKDQRLQREGALKAAVEEYVEAVLFYQFITTGKLRPITALNIETEVFLAGLCDLPGELYRYAVKAASNGDTKTVKKCAALGQSVVGELIEFNLTKYLRTKFDQAKSAVHKLENVVYELSLRDK